MMTEVLSFNRLLSEKNLLLVDFYADWCEPCKWAEPVLEEVIRNFDGKLSLHKVDIDALPELARQYHVMSVPTLVLFKNNHEVWRMKGFDIAPKLITRIKGYIN
jgi:thioredoxin 1